MDHTVHGILQARIRECVAFPFSRGSSQPRNQTRVSCTTGRFFTNWAIREALSVLHWVHICMKCSLGISNFLDEISSLSRSIVILYFFALITLEGFLFFFSSVYFFFISWRLITLQYCSGFCHTLTRISHGFTCIPHPDPPSHLSLHPIPLGLPSAPGPHTCLMHPTWAGDLFHPR